MKRFLVIGLSAAALAGCATPQYPVSQGYVAPPPVKPQYPVREAKPQPAPDPESAPSASRDSAAQTEAQPVGSPAPAAVESAPLGPVTTEPQPPAQPSAATAPAAQGPAPAQSPPPVAPPVPQPAPPPEVYEAPAPRSVVRYVTDGNVVAARGMYRDYEVQKGDHLDAIARDLNTTRRELVEANHLRKPYRVRPGEHLKVPVAKAYVVAPGDTLGAVAKRFGVGLGELSALNDLPERGRLTAGMYVALPTHYEDHGPSRTIVTEQAYAAPRPRTSYRPAPTTGYGPPATGGPYVPSPEALAAGAARRAQAAQPSTSPNFAYARPSGEVSRPAEAPVNAPALASLGQGKFIWPVRGDILSKFGASGAGRRNDGVDISAPLGAEVRATAVGEVVYAGDQVPGFGNLVLIKHAGGWVSAYAHLANVDVRMRENVYQGQQIGSVGATGGVTQPQLHFEIRYAATTADKATPIDPLLVLPQ